MTKLEYQPFDKKELREKLAEKFPQYLVRSSFGNTQVRTKGFTVTGNVNLNLNGKKGLVKTQTNYDMFVVYLLFFWPLAIYIYTKRDKQKKLEEEVVTKLNEILQPV